MKTDKIIVIAFFIIVAFSCNNEQTKKVEHNSITIKKRVPINPIVTKITKTSQNDLKPCEYIVMEMLKTSPRYKHLTKGLNQAIIKNGGTSFGISLDGSPNPSQDKAWSYSRTYDFTIYETYTDRRLNTARFTFDPHKKVLFEYDPFTDQLTPIEFDRNLLAKFDTLCN